MKSLHLTNNTYYPFFRTLLNEIEVILLAKDIEYDTRLLEDRIHQSRAVIIKNDLTKRYNDAYLTTMVFDNLELTKKNNKNIYIVRSVPELILNKRNNGLSSVHDASEITEFELLNLSRFNLKLTMPLSHNDNYASYDNANNNIYIICSNNRLAINNSIVTKGYVYNPLSYYENIMDEHYDNLPYEFDESKMIYLKNVILSQYGLQLPINQHSPDESS